jgi:hypothetical protein
MTPLISHSLQYFCTKLLLLSFLLLCSDWSIRCNIPMHKTVVMRFIEALTVMMAPITPHWCEMVWGLLGRAGSVCDASWPAWQPCDRKVRKEYIFFRDFLKNFRLGSIKLKVAAPKAAHVYLASTYEPAKIEVRSLGTNQTLPIVPQVISLYDRCCNTCRPSATAPGGSPRPS